MQSIRPILIAVICALPGCASTFNDLPYAASSIIEGQDPSASPGKVAKLEPGTEISIVERRTSGTKVITRGTVLKSGPEGIALINCVRSAWTSPQATPLPFLLGATGVFKNSGVGATHVPVQWISIREMTSVSVLNPSPEHYVAPQVAIDMNDSQFFERIGIDFDFDTKDGSDQKGLKEHFITSDVQKSRSTSQ